MVNGLLFKKNKLKNYKLIKRGKHKVFQDLRDPEHYIYVSKGKNDCYISQICNGYESDSKLGVPARIMTCGGKLYIVSHATNNGIMSALHDTAFTNYTSYGMICNCAYAINGKEVSFEDFEFKRLFLIEDDDYFKKNVELYCELKELNKFLKLDDDWFKILCEKSKFKPIHYKFHNLLNDI